MSRNNKQWLGLPLHLIWGYIAIAVFMTGDGFELAFLSLYIKSRIPCSVSGLWIRTGKLWVNPAVLRDSWFSVSAISLLIYRRYYS